MFLKKRSHSVCTVCGVHFEPGRGSDKWPNFCYEHRKEFVASDDRRNTVIQWASTNWQKLEEQAKKDIDASEAAVRQYSKQRIFSQMANSQQAAMSNPWNSPLGGIFKTP